ncbi:MAG TPA: metallophosphoesterase [Polyangiaceae bacterium]|nr:metallophosphoesterase [Polyangiaceae bacterium]
MKRLKWAAIGALIAFVALTTYAFTIEPARLVVKHEALDIPNWPAALSGLRVALLSDLHVGAPHWGEARTRALIAQVNAEHADLILLAGDYMIHDVKFGSRVAEPGVAELLGELHAPLGVVAVFGNHDGWHGPALRPLFEAKGIHALDDEVFEVETRGTRFCVLGLTDEAARKRTATQELALAPSGVPLLVLVHEPDVFPELDSRVSLTLAGHTHGGQVRLPLIGRPIVRSRYHSRYAAGHIVEAGRHLFVTTGIGTSVWPVRFGVPPEYVVLTLH